MVARSVVIADKRRTSDGISQKNCNKNKVYIHDRSKRSHTVFSGKIHKLNIVQRVYNGTGKVGHQFGRTVSAGAQKNFPVKVCAPEFKKAGIFACKIKDRKQTTDTFAGDRCKCRTGQTNLEHSYQ